MKIRQILIITSSIILLFLFILTGTLSYEAGKEFGVENAEKIRSENQLKTEKFTKKRKTVLVSKVKNKLVKNNIRSSGKVYSSNNVTILSEVQGKIFGINDINEGTEFNKGDIICQIKNDDFRLLLRSKKSRFLSLLSNNLVDIKIDYNTEYPKWLNYFNSININKTLPNLPEMEDEKQFIINRLILADFEAIKSDEVRLNKYFIKAPFNGIITKSYTDIGGNVNPGSPIVDFIRKDNLEVELAVNSKEISLIKLGDEVKFNESGKIYNGKIIRMGKSINSKTQNFSVYSSISSNHNNIYDGMFLDGIITTLGSEESFKIPKRAEIEKNIIYIVENDKLKKQVINIINDEGDYYIVDNLKNGQLVVNEPVIDIKEGTIVNTILN